MSSVPALILASSTKHTVDQMGHLTGLVEAPLGFVARQFKVLLGIPFQFSLNDHGCTAHSATCRRSSTRPPTTPSSARWPEPWLKIKHSKETGGLDLDNDLRTVRVVLVFLGVELLSGKVVREKQGDLGLLRQPLRVACSRAAGASAGAGPDTAIYDRGVFPRRV